MGNISKLTPILYDKGETNFNHNGLGKLTKLLANEIDEVLNGEFEAFFEYPANGHLADKIDNEMFIKAKPNKKDGPHVFKIYDYELDTFTQTYLIYARSKNIEDLRNNVILDVNVRGLAPTQAWNLAKNNALDPVVTTFYSDITITSSVNWERRSLLSTIAGQEGSMIQYWGGEIKHGIDRISLLRRRGQDNVTTVRHGKNLDGLKTTYSTKGLVTAIVPYYVKDDGKAVYGDVVESEYINNYPSTYYDIIEYNDEELGLTQEDEPESGWEDSTIRTKLNRVAERYFDENAGKDLPSINMEISLEDISQTKEYGNFKDFEQIEIGDTITVYSKKFDLNINAKVRRVIYNGLTDKNELVEVGTARRSLYDDVRDEFKKVETELKEGIDHALISADGKNTNYYGTADPNEVGLVGQPNDTYFRTNGSEKEIWRFTGTLWELIMDTSETTKNADAIAEQQQEIEDTKTAAQSAVDKSNTAIQEAGFARVDASEALSSIAGVIVTAESAYDNAGTAIANAQTALNNASSALSSVTAINAQIDEIQGTLFLTAKTETVNAIAGRVTTAEGNISANATAISQRLTETEVNVLVDGKGYAKEASVSTRINDIQSTVDGTTQTIASLRTDVDGKATTTQFNTLNTTVNGTITRVGNAEGRLTTVETNISGIQTTVASKASQSQVTQLATLVDTKVTSSQVNASILADKRYKDTRNDNQLPSWYYATYTKETVMEFKNLTTMGISGEGTYGILETIVPWSNASGGGIKQTLRTDLGVWEREQNGSSAWRTWRKTADQTWVGAQVSVLENNINLRVAKGDVVSQLNIDAGRTLISSSKILLNANTVTISGTAWMSGAVITNASITGAKIADATIGSAKIASLDVSKISGNRTEFVQSYWNSAVGGGVSIAGNGIRTVDTSGESSVLSRGAINFYARNGAYTGRVDTSYSSIDGKPGISIFMDGLSHFSLVREVADVFDPIMYVEATAGQINFSRHLNLNTNDIVNVQTIRFRGADAWLERQGVGNVRIVSSNTEAMLIGETTIQISRNISMAGNFTSDISLNTNNIVNFQTLRFRGADAWLERQGVGNISIVSQSTQAILIGGSTVQMYRDLNMNGRNVTGQSDIRLKTNIIDRQESSLEKINALNFVDFKWINQGRDDFGVIAQQVRQVAPELILEGADGYLNLNNSLLNMMTTHALQELSLREQNTNQVASQALQATETNTQKIERLEKRIEELEGAM